MGSKVIVGEVKTRTYNLELTQDEANVLYTLLDNVLRGDIVSDSKTNLENGSLFNVLMGLYRADGVKNINSKLTVTEIKDYYGSSLVKVNFKK